jgi:parallel beta-helix repeat protein
MHGEEGADQDAGGGFYVFTATATIHDNQIYDNHAIDGVGGGLFLQSSDSVIKANDIYSNTAKGGGGLGTEGGGNLRLWGWTIRDNEIRDNEAGGGGGGISTMFNRGCTIAGNTISGNKALDGGGGGLGLFISSLLIKDNLITHNYARDPGGGLSFLGTSESTLVNNVITDNESFHDSSAMHVEGVDLHLLHNTFARNTPTQKNAIGVEPWTGYGGPSTVVMTDTILADSDVGIKVTSGNTVTVNSILWYDVSQPIAAEAGATVTLANDFTGDPAFAPDGYHLTGNSAALDKGINAGVAEDIDGDPRPIGEGFDLGADEMPKYVFLPAILK